MKEVISLLCLTVLFTTAWAQNDKRYIEVNGSAETEIAADIIVLSIRLEEYLEGKEKVTLDKLDADFTNAVGKSGIAKDKVVLSDLSLNSFQLRRKDRDFFAQKTYEITFSKTDEVLKFLEGLKTVKIDFVQIAKLSHTEIEKYRLETKIAALKAAERKADALLGSVGSKKGKALLINESPDETFTYTPNSAEYSRGTYKMSNYQAYSYSASEEINSEISLKKIKLRFEIVARFEIE